MSTQSSFFDEPRSILSDALLRGAAAVAATYLVRPQGSNEIRFRYIPHGKPSFMFGKPFTKILNIRIEDGCQLRNDAIQIVCSKVAKYIS